MLPDGLNSDQDPYLDDSDIIEDEVQPAPPVPKREGGEGNDRPQRVGPSGYRPADEIAGKYRLVAVIGEGDKSSVWLAKNTALGSDVAIKLIGEQASSTAGETLLREARAAARIDHPCAVRTFDFGKTGRGEPFIVMEILKGEDLATTLRRRGRMEPARCVQIVLPVIEAVAAVHTKGMTHGDLEPANVFLVSSDTDTRQVKVLNFGVGHRDDDEDTITLPREEPVIVGSRGHMSPERASGGDWNEKTDVWSVCALLCQLLTGRLPFDGTTDEALTATIQTHAPRPITELGVGEADLWRVLEGGLQKNPEMRPTMHKLGERLARWAVAKGIESDVSGSSLAVVWGATAKPAEGDATGPADLPPELGPRRGWIWVATALGTLTIGIVIIALTSGAPSDPKPTDSPGAKGAAARPDGNARSHPTGSQLAGEPGSPGSDTATAASVATTTPTATASAPAASVETAPPTAAPGPLHTAPTPTKPPGGASPQPPPPSPPPPNGAMPVPTQAPF